MEEPSKPKITVMYCINSLDEKTILHENTDQGVELKFVKMPCSSMVKDLFMLRAFEAGSDAVIIFVCPEGHCRYVEGNLRAKKRVAWVQNLLNEIGLDGKRLLLHNVSPKNPEFIHDIFRETLNTIDRLGFSPAR
jgi:coenzyme F420-reducing hydrogenase delta subunit